MKPECCNAYCYMEQLWNKVRLIANIKLYIVAFLLHYFAHLSWAQGFNKLVRLVDSARNGHSALETKVCQFTTCVITLIIKLVTSLSMPHAILKFASAWPCGYNINMLASVQLAPIDCCSYESEYLQSFKVGSHGIEKSIFQIANKSVIHLQVGYFQLLSEFRKCVLWLTIIKTSHATTWCDTVSCTT